MANKEPRRDERENTDKSKEKAPVGNVKSEADVVEEKHRKATQSTPNDGGSAQDNPNEHG
jgi:hypothetical protein